MHNVGFDRKRHDECLVPGAQTTSKLLDALPDGSQHIGGTAAVIYKHTDACTEVVPLLKDFDRQLTVVFKNEKIVLLQVRHEVSKFILHCGKDTDEVDIDTEGRLQRQQNR